MARSWLRAERRMARSWERVESWVESPLPDALSALRAEGDGRLPRAPRIVEPLPRIGRDRGRHERLFDQPFGPGGHALLAEPLAQRHQLVASERLVQEGIAEGEAPGIVI